ncbi:hypothetical protein E2C01_020197 [Portunus trituberculatus]|uniref:Uncharacterized protein n=1 Tax=Portunus trituberculatus TaxID=210409 RepID=A0A5B7E0N8_PORTR|nr:hypothetical protein [Portunus trituberculatus]
MSFGGADRLAQRAIQDDTVDPGTEHTLGYVKNSIKDFVHSSISDQLELCCHEGCSTSLHYARVSQSCAYIYGRHTASHDRVAMRFRLGYKYFWEVSASPEGHHKPQSDLSQLIVGGCDFYGPFCSPVPCPRPHEP